MWAEWCVRLHVLPAAHRTPSRSPPPAPPAVYKDHITLADYGEQGWRGLQLSRRGAPHQPPAHLAGPPCRRPPPPRRTAEIHDGMGLELYYN